MARSVILASFFTTGVYAARVADKSSAQESQAVVDASDFVPGQLLSTGLRSATMAGGTAVVHWNASGRFGDTHQMDLHGGVGRRVSIPSMYEYELQMPGYHPNLPGDRKSVDDATIKTRGSVDDEDDQMSGPLAEASHTLNRDITQALRFDHAPQRLAPTNWDLFTDQLETVFTAADPTTLRLLRAVIPSSWGMSIKGLRWNQRVMQELRKLAGILRFSKVLVSDDVDVSTHIDLDPSTGEEVIESRWIAKLVTKRLQIPRWPAESAWPLFNQNDTWKSKRLIEIEAVSRFDLNAEGKIYRQSINELKLLVDGKALDSSKLGKLLNLFDGPRLQRPPVPRVQHVLDDQDQGKEVLGQESGLAAQLLELLQPGQHGAAKRLALLDQPRLKTILGTILVLSFFPYLLPGDQLPEDLRLTFEDFRDEDFPIDPRDFSIEYPFDTRFQQSIEWREQARRQELLDLFP